MNTNITPATGRSLYSIEMEYLRIADLLIDNGGELDDETENALKINKDELTLKATGFALLTKELDCKVDVIDLEIERLNKLKKSYSSSSDRIKHSISEAMKLYGIDKIEGELIRLSFRSSSSVVVSDENLILEKYKVKKEEWSISKTKIKEDLDAGIEVSGASKVSKKSLQIK